MSLAFVFAGQGSQKLGMGKDFYDNYPEFKALWDEIDTDGDYKRLCFGDNLEELSKTENTQPCMVLFAVCLSALLKIEGIIPVAACGLSLGEYSALALSGVFSPKEAVDFVKFRGKAMSESCKDKETAMYAVVGADRQNLQKVCEKAASYGVCQISNYNCSSQIVIGGEQKAVEEACRIIRDNAYGKVIPLNVSGAFHTQLMNDASVALSKKLADIRLGNMQIPIIFNCTGKTEEDVKIKELLTLQVKSSVYFEDSIKLLEKMGVDKIVEIGPGKVLSGFIKKTAKSIKTFPVENIEGYLAVLKEFKGDEKNA